MPGGTVAALMVVVVMMVKPRGPRRSDLVVMVVVEPLNALFALQ